MIPFLLTNIVALVVFLACATALYPDPDHDNQKKNTLLDLYLPQRGTQGLYQHLPQQALGDTLFLLQLVHQLEPNRRPRPPQQGEEDTRE